MRKYVLKRKRQNGKVSHSACYFKEKWLGRMENNKETTLEEEFVSMAFGEPFVKELKMGIVGSWMCPSVITNHLTCTTIQTCNVMGPAVHFNQADGKDLCVSKALASALFC
ncbi:hypothetical protein MHU86_14961 [Fragilaria crotonensis]|nr:hypothetical protein MHU86_14961 [Fragilaria crotonensis]